MLRQIFIFAGVLFALPSAPVAAATLKATSTSFKAVFAKARAGDTIVLSGKFGRLALTNRSFSSAVTIDARAVTFTDTLSLSRVTGVKILGGRYGNSTAAATAGIRVSGGSNVTISGGTFVGNGGRSHGIDVNGTTNVTVSGNSFTRLRLGVGFVSVTGGKLLSNTSVRASSDGFNVADSHNVLVSRNSCSGTVISAGAHPDCVQMWSVAGHKPQSDIEISDNIATGATQGFTSFNGSAGGGDRISMLRNRVDTTYPQGIACYECRNSVFTGNVLTTQPGAKYRTSMNIVGGSNNTISGNSIGALARAAVGALGMSALAMASDPWDDITGSAGEAVAFTTAATSLADRAAVTRGGFEAQTSAAAAAVPEPGVWALMVGGFGLAGIAARRRRRRVVAA